VILDGRLRQIQDATNRLVALALHHERQHIELSSGQAEVSGRDRRRISSNASQHGAGKREVFPREDFGRNIDATGKHQL